MLQYAEIFFECYFYNFNKFLEEPGLSYLSVIPTTLHVIKL